MGQRVTSHGERDEVMGPHGVPAHTIHQCVGVPHDGGQARIVRTDVGMARQCSKVDADGGQGRINPSRLWLGKDLYEGSRGCGFQFVLVELGEGESCQRRKHDVKVLRNGGTSCRGDRQSEPEKLNGARLEPEDRWARSPAGLRVVGSSSTKTTPSSTSRGVAHGI
jgi:hypothetical protein